MTKDELIAELQKAKGNPKVKFAFWVDGDPGDSGCEVEQEVQSVYSYDKEIILQ